MNRTSLKKRKKNKLRAVRTNFPSHTYTRGVINTYNTTSHAVLLKYPQEWYIAGKIDTTKRNYSLYVCTARAYLYPFISMPSSGKADSYRTRMRFTASINKSSTTPFYLLYVCVFYYHINSIRFEGV